jgi:hypothetical protein
VPVTVNTMPESTLCAADHASPMGPPATPVVLKAFARAGTLTRWQEAAEGRGAPAPVERAMGIISKSSPAVRPSSESGRKESSG